MLLGCMELVFKRNPKRGTYSKFNKDKKEAMKTLFEQVFLHKKYKKTWKKHEKTWKNKEKNIKNQPKITN